MANHLIIGLGGTGGKVLREMRKRIYEEFRSNEPGHNVYVDYIYVDSSPADLDSRDGWSIMGKSVHLGEAQKVSINGISANMFQNLNMYPGVKSFLSSDDVNLMTSKLGPLITAGIGGQRRRLGRTLLANNLAVGDANSDFVSRLKQVVKKLMDQSNEAQVTFHVCAGLAGGTGSGSIVDVVSQIRKEFAPQPGGDLYKVFLYLYVPEMVVANMSHDSGYYQANGYGALTELNAMSVGQYHPFDVTGQTDNFTGQVQRLLQGINAFEGAYLYTNINEKGKTLDISKELPASVADFLYQKIVSRSMSNGGAMSHLEGCENDGAGPENDLAGQAVRSRKFLSFGIKRIEYPESEIEEFVTYSYATQAARQFAYNYWQEGVGFGERSMEEVGTGFLDEIKEKNNRSKLLLSNNHLMLALPIIETPTSKKWKNIVSTWEDRCQSFADDVQVQAKKESWLGEYSALCDDYFNNNFRTHGVKKFYQIQNQEKVAYAKFIRRHIEKILFDEWQSGEKSVLEVEKYVKLLLADCESRITAFKEKMAETQTAIDTANAQVHDANVEWNNIGWLKDALLGTSKKVFSAYKTAKCDLYTNMTLFEGMQYAVGLLQSLIEQFGVMLQGVVTFKTMLDEVLKEVATQADSKCKTETNGSDDDRTVKKYAPEAVRQFAKQCCANADAQKTNALAIRNRMVQMLGEEGEHSFANLYDKMDYATTVSTILDECQKNADHAMEDAAKSDPTTRMIGVNILEKLKQEYNTDEKLESFVRGVVNQAQCYLQFNAEEQGKVIAGNNNSMMKMIQVSIPEYPGDQSGFRNKLIATFGLVYPGFNPKEDVSINYKNNQIVVVAAASGFPLRYVQNVKVLKQKYENLLASPDGQLNRMVLHTETFKKPLPSLFEMTAPELEQMITPKIMLGYALGLFQRKSDPTTGETFDAINFFDELLQEDNWTKAGKNIIDTIKMLSQNYGLAMKVIGLIEKTMAKNVRTNDQKLEMIKALNVVVKSQILPHPICENNEFSPVYERYVNIVRTLAQTELKAL